MHSLKNTINSGLMTVGLSFGLMVSASAKPLENSTDPIQEFYDKMEAEAVQNPSMKSIGMDYFSIGNYYQDKARKAEEDRNEQEAQKNYVIAFKWYQKLANLTGEQAGEHTWLGQIEIADMYYDGHGVQINEAKATEWYKKTCEETGYAKPCSLLDLMENGVVMETSDFNGIVNKDWVDRVTKFKQ